LLERAHMANCNPYWTLVDTKSKLGPEDVCVQDPTLYRSHVGGLQYLTFIRPNLMYAVQQICLYMHDLQEPHFVAPTHADWTGFPSTRPSSSGYCVFLGDNLLSWSEYLGITNVVVETAWLRNMLRELHSPLSPTTLVYYHNVSAIYLSSNPVQHQREKHIEIDIHFVCDMVTADEVRVLHVPSRY
ncbi:ribonuclease H-like domain-containing protein, partial [Tanacetum coccineum]